MSTEWGLSLYFCVWKWVQPYYYDLWGEKKAVTTVKYLIFHKNAYEDLHLLFPCCITVKNEWE